MKITYEEMKDIAKTLPIGYYLGRKVEVVIDPSGGAFADIVKGVIHVGFDIINQAATKIDATEAEKWNRERLLRCVLYHEVGHLLLTPNDLVSCAMYAQCYVLDKDVKTWVISLPMQTRHSIMNIFEDERLECILSGVFMDVDFKAFCRLVNKGAVTKSEIGELIHIIRLRKTDAAISNRIDDIIYECCGLHRGRKCDNTYYKLLKIYINLVYTLAYDLIGKPKKEEPEKHDSSDGGPEKDEKDGKDDGKDENPTPTKRDEGKDSGEEDKGEDEHDNGDGCGDGEDEVDDEGDDGDGESGGSDDEEASAPTDDDSEKTPRKPHISSDYLNNVGDGLFATPTPEVGAKFDQLARRLAKRKGLAAAGCYSALHGKINVKRDAMDKDRIFRRFSDVGDMINSGTNITLWIDTSGSFYESVPVLNRILSAANRVAKMSCNVNINVVKMTNRAVVADDDDWEINALGGNYIGKSYLNAWKRTRGKGRRNIDIVVFDGDAKSDAPLPVEKFTGKPIEQLIWNHPDCYIVTDKSNYSYFKPLANAHITYVSKNYAELLEKEFVKIVDRIV